MLVSSWALINYPCFRKHSSLNPSLSLSLYTYVCVYHIYVGFIYIWIYRYSYLSLYMNLSTYTHTELQLTAFFWLKDIEILSQTDMILLHPSVLLVTGYQNTFFFKLNYLLKNKCNMDIFCVHYCFITPFGINKGWYKHSLYFSILCHVGFMYLNC